MDTARYPRYQDDRELLRLDLNLEVSACFDLEEPSALCLWHSNHPEIRLEIKKIYDRDYPEPIAKTPRLFYPQLVAFEPMR